MHDNAYTHAVVKELSIGILHSLAPLRLCRHRKVDRQWYASTSSRHMAAANKTALLVGCVEFKCTGTDIATASPAVDRLIEYANSGTIFMKGEVATDKSTAICQSIGEEV